MTPTGDMCFKEAEIYEIRGRKFESVNRERGNLPYLQILMCVQHWRKKSYRYISQGSTKFKFRQKVKQMLSYEFRDEACFADNKLQVAQVQCHSLEGFRGVGD